MIFTDLYFFGYTKCDVQKQYSTKKVGYALAKDEPITGLLLELARSCDDVDDEQVTNYTEYCDQAI